MVKRRQHNRAELMAKMAQAQKTLEERGWQFLASVMNEPTTNCEGYGLLYLKHPGRKFYLNVETIDNLPCD